MDLIRCIVRVVDDCEVSELICSLRRNLACLARCCIQSSLRTAKGHRIQIAQTVTLRYSAGHSLRAEHSRRSGHCYYCYRGNHEDVFHFSSETVLDDLVAERRDVD